MTNDTDRDRSIAILEDQEIAVDGMRANLESRGFKVFSAPDLIGFLELVAQAAPALAILDLKLGRTDHLYGGFEALRVLKERWPSIKCIILTQHPDPENFRRALEWNAEGFLDKNTTGGAKLLGAVEAVLRGERVYDDGARSEALRTRAPQSGRPRLTKAELRILGLFRQHEWTNEQIASELTISREAVKTHFANIYRKLEVHDRRAAVTRAHELGLFRDLS